MTACCILECATHTVVVKASLSGFDVTAVAVVGCEYDEQVLKL